MFLNSFQLEQLRKNNCSVTDREGYPNLMDLMIQARCSYCDKLFCCPEHRRSHELLVHKKCRKMIPQPDIKKRSESYALEMRKILYTEQNRSNFHKSRKRKYVTIVHEQEQIELKLSDRKILIPRRKQNETSEPSKSTITGKVTEEEGNADTISPIEEKKGQDVPIIFTTSTPLAKRAHLLSCPQVNVRHFSVPLESIVEVSDIPVMFSEIQRETVETIQKETVQSIQKDSLQIATSFQKRKVTFSESVESLYDTASEIKTPERKRGIFATVANAFSSAFHRIPGMELPEETFAVPCSPGGSKRKRASREIMRGPLAITGRRPLYQRYKLLSPEN